LFAPAKREKFQFLGKIHKKIRNNVFLEGIERNENNENETLL